MGKNELSTRVIFDYAGNEIEGELKGRLIQLATVVGRGRRQFNESIIAIGAALKSAHHELATAGKDGKFSAWVGLECGFSRSTAYNYMSVAEAFVNCPSLGQFTREALYLLSSDKTPKRATTYAIKKADGGLLVNKAVAEQIIDRYTVQAEPEDDPDPEDDDTEDAEWEPADGEGEAEAAESTEAAEDAPESDGGTDDEEDYDEPEVVTCTRCAGLGTLTVDASMPENLQTEAFINCWQDWVEFRAKEKKKPLTTSNIARQFKELSGWGPEKSIRALEAAMKVGYQGYFDPDGDKAKAMSRKQQNAKEDLTL